MSRLPRSVLARIEHVAALDHEIELVVRPHRGARGTGVAAKASEADGGEKITA